MLRTATNRTELNGTEVKLQNTQTPSWGGGIGISLEWIKHCIDGK